MIVRPLISLEVKSAKAQGKDFSFYDGFGFVALHLALHRKQGRQVMALSICTSGNEEGTNLYHWEIPGIYFVQSEGGALEIAPYGNARDTSQERY